MSQRLEDNYLVDAIATYICVYGRKHGVFIPEVDISSICKELGVSYTVQYKAREKARKIYRDFL